MDNNSPVFLKQMAIRKMVVDMAIPEKTIELVIAHSFKQAHKAFNENASVEISGFGKFVTRPLVTGREKAVFELRKAHWQKELENPLLNDRMRNARIGWIKQVEEYLEVIKKIEHEI